MKRIEEDAHKKRSLNFWPPAKEVEMKFQWVERDEKLSAFGEEFDSAEEAKTWAREWLAQMNYTPEHLEIFLITKKEIPLNGGIYKDLYKEEGRPVAFRTLLGY